MKEYHEMAEDLFQRRDRYLTEKKKKRNTVIKALSGMACLCLAVLSGIRIRNESAFPEAEPYVVVNPIPLERQTQEHLPSKENETGSTSPEPENLSETHKGITDLDLPLSVNSGEGSVSGESETATGKDSIGLEDGASQPAGPDAPVSELSPGSLQAVRVNGDSADFFGGSYTDSQGLLCILLTKNTPENRRTICQELNLPESNVTFRDADYTLAYLTKLQASISEGMISKELDFVVISALREDTNRIHLTVTTQDASQLDKLRALDSLGGALEIEYTSGGPMIKDMAAPITE